MGWTPRAEKQPSCWSTCGKVREWRLSQGAGFAFANLPLSAQQAIGTAQPNLNDDEDDRCLAGTMKTRAANFYAKA